MHIAKIALGAVVVLLGAALTAYAIPPASFVALAAIVVGVAAMGWGAGMVWGSTRRAR